MSEFKTGLEIERKYIIRMPSASSVSKMESCTADVIVQTYLTSDEGTTHRVRSRTGKAGTRYYETVKRRVDGMSAVESEREICAAEYELLLPKIANGTTPIRKTRHSFIYLGQLFEIDIYPQWHHTAILETELATRETAVEFPDFIEVVREVTGLKGYSNAAMSRHFPAEDVV